MSHLLVSNTKFIQEKKETKYAHATNCVALLVTEQEITGITAKDKSFYLCTTLELAISNTRKVGSLSSEERGIVSA